MLRRSQKHSLFRKEIFNAPSSFSNKLTGSAKIIDNWRKIHNNVDIIYMNKKNTLPIYFEFIIKKLSPQIQNELNNCLSKQENIYEVFSNKDKFHPIIYLLTYILGFELSEQETYIKDKLSFNFVKNFIQENINFLNKKSLKIDNKTLLNFLLIPNHDLASNRLDDFFFKKFLNIGVYESFLLYQLKIECKKKLFEIKNNF